jgi:hypothetical protein
MEYIKHNSVVDKTEREKVKRELQNQMGGGKKVRVPEKEIAEVIREKNLKKLSSSFRSTERDQL